MNVQEFKFTVEDRVAYNKPEHALFVKAGDHKWCIKSWEGKAMPPAKEVMDTQGTFLRGCEFAREVMRGEILKLV